jgi:hypothetical protein
LNIPKELELAKKIIPMFVKFGSMTPKMPTSGAGRAD